MFDLLPRQEAHVIINHDFRGFSRRFITAAREQGGIRCSIVETMCRWNDGTYKDCPNLLWNDNLPAALGAGPEVQQCVLVIETHHNKEPHEINVDARNVQFLEICHALKIPVLAAVLRQHDYLCDPGAEISLQSVFDRELVEQIVFLDPHIDSSTYAINPSMVSQRNTEFADGLLRLIGTKFFNLPTISRVSPNMACINASQ